MLTYRLVLSFAQFVDERLTFPGLFHGEGRSAFALCEVQVESDEHQHDLVGVVPFLSTVSMYWRWCGALVGGIERPIGEEGDVHPVQSYGAGDKEILLSISSQNCGNSLTI